jgi:hypothetical protein
MGKLLKAKTEKACSRCSIKNRQKVMSRHGDPLAYGKPAVTKVGEREGEGREEAKCMNARPDCISISGGY